MIRNIIFDFGNVLFDLDLGAFEREMATQLGESFSTVEKGLFQERVFELYETGGLSTGEFVEKICSLANSRGRVPDAPNDLTAHQVISAWNAIFIGMPKHRFEMLLRLRRHYKVFLLSNINDLHERWITDYMLREHGLGNYEPIHFDGVYFSHLVRLRKPSTEVFEYVLADAEISPEETVFFDDLPENVNAAQQVGIQGIWHDPGTDIGERLANMGLLPRQNFNLS